MAGCLNISARLHLEVIPSIAILIKWSNLKAWSHLYYAKSYESDYVGATPRLHPSLVAMLERRPQSTPPQLKRPVVTLELYPRLVVAMFERRSDYTPPTLKVKQIITLEPCPGYTPPQPKKPLVMLGRRKVVTLKSHKITQQQPRCLAPVTTEQEPPSTSTNTTQLRKNSNNCW